MNARTMTIALSITAALTSVVLITPTAAAAPSCVAQSIPVEHELYGAAWGHDLIAFLATHPEVLAEFGFNSFGDLAAYSTHQDHANCPPDL